MCECIARGACEDHQQHCLTLCFVCIWFVCVGFALLVCLLFFFCLYFVFLLFFLICIIILYALGCMRVCVGLFVLNYLKTQHFIVCTNEELLCLLIISDLICSVFNPRRTCAARVKVVAVSVCLCVCLSVR